VAIWLWPCLWLHVADIGVCECHDGHFYDWEQRGGYSEKTPLRGVNVKLHSGEEGIEYKLHCMHQCVPTIVVSDAPEIHLKFYLQRNIVSAQYVWPQRVLGFWGSHWHSLPRRKPDVGYSLGDHWGQEVGCVQVWFMVLTCHWSCKCECLNHSSLSRCLWRRMVARSCKSTVSIAAVGIEQKGDMDKHVTASELWLLGASKSKGL